MKQFDGKFLASNPVSAVASAAELEEMLSLVAGEESASFLEALISRATAAIEEHCRHSLRRADYRLHFSGSGEAVLPVFPVAKLVSAAVNGEVVDVSALTLSIRSGSFVVSGLPDGETVLTVSAGYGEGDQMPETAKAAVLALAADLYEHRESQQEANLSANGSMRYLIEPLVFLKAGW